MNFIPNTKASTLILTLIMALSILAFPTGSKAGIEPPSSPATDVQNYLLVGYWDLRERESFFQVTNVTGDPQRVHIQIYDATNNCVEFDYYDTLTPRDTHVYNVADLDRNNGEPLNAPDLTDGHGIVSVMQVESDDSFSFSAASPPLPALTGNFTIQDSDGYQYRNNLAGAYFNQSPTNHFHRVNFSDIDGASFADLVVINLNVEDDPGRVVPVPQFYEIILYDEDENPISCPVADFSCGEGIVSAGINQAITNSRGGPSVCLGNDTSGFVELDAVEEEPADLQFMFIGLNDGSGTGSMVDGTIVGTEIVPTPTPIPSPTP